MTRVFLLVLTLFLASFFAGLLPEGFVPPDLWFLYALAVALWSRPASGLLFAFGAGLVADLVGGGYLGIMAVGLVSAAYVAQGLASWVSLDEPVGWAVVYLGAYLAKWAGVFAVVYVLSLFAVGPWDFLEVALKEAAVTAVFAPFYLVLARRVLEREGERAH